MKATLKNAANIVISITKKDGEVIFDKKKIELLNMNGYYIASPISLKVGEYLLTEFLITDDSNKILYATPIADSNKAYLVDKPLSIDFEIIKDVVLKLKPEVISVEESSPADFGYSTLSYNFVTTFNFHLSTFIYNQSDLNFELSSLKLEIKDNDKVLYSGDLEAKTNNIRLRDDASKYEITVSKEGYNSYVYNFTPDSLGYYNVSKSNGPLEVVLFKDGETSVTPIEYITVQGGTFQMGNNSGQFDESPVHTVTLSDFKVAKYEVTQSQFIEFLNDINCNEDGSFDDAEFGNVKYVVDMSADYCPITYIGGKFYFKGSDSAPTTNCPAIGISWHGANAFCKWAGGRLPHEAEWEFAAKGGNNSNGYLYVGSNDFDEVAWYYNNSNLVSHPVGLKKANELGIYDMNGNVWEWCADWYGDYPSEAQVNPIGPDSGTYRVNRGAGHRSNNGAGRVTNRHDNAPGYYQTHGVRIAKSVE